MRLSARVDYALRAAAELAVRGDGIANRAEQRLEIYHVRAAVALSQGRMIHKHLASFVLHVRPMGCFVPMGKRGCYHAIIGAFRINYGIPAMIAQGVPVHAFKSFEARGKLRLREVH